MGFHRIAVPVTPKNTPSKHTIIVFMGLAQNPLVAKRFLRLEDSGNRVIDSVVYIANLDRPERNHNLATWCGTGCSTTCRSM
jgi:hypothetical protein